MIFGFLTAVVAIAVLGLWGLFRARKQAPSDGTEDHSDLDVLTAVARDAAMPDPKPEIEGAAPEPEGDPTAQADELDAPAEPGALRLDADAGDLSHHGDDDETAIDEEDGQDDDGYDDLSDLAERMDQTPIADLNEDVTSSEIAGADLLSAGIQVTVSGPVPIMADYDPEEDQLVVVFDPDDLNGNEPEISVVEGPGEEDVTVLLNGRAVMVVLAAAGLTPDAIELIEGDTSVPDNGAVAAAA